MKERERLKLVKIINISFGIGGNPEKLNRSRRRKDLA